MAANLQGRGFAKLGKRFVQGNRIPVLRDPSNPVSTAFRRGAHSYVYDKNLDDQVRPAVVPDDVIESKSGKYWAPNAQTGIFGPAEHDGRAAGGERTSSLPPPPTGSVLEQTAWFRPLEDVDKSPHL